MITLVQRNVIDGLTAGAGIGNVEYVLCGNGRSGAF